MKTENEQAIHDFFMARGVPTQEEVQQQFIQQYKMGAGVDKGDIAAFCLYGAAALDLLFEGFIESYDGMNQSVSDLCERFRSTRKAIRLAYQESGDYDYYEMLTDWYEEGGSARSEEEVNRAEESVELLNKLYNKYIEAISAFSGTYRSGDDVDPRFYIGTSFIHYASNELDGCNCMPSKHVRKDGVDLSPVDGRIKEIRAEATRMQGQQAIRDVEESSSQGLSEILDEANISVN